MVGSGTSTRQHQVKRRFRVEWLTPSRFAVAERVSVVVQCVMNWANVAALVTSRRFLEVEKPQALHRQRVVPLDVVPLRFISAPQWQRGRFFGIGSQHHQPIPHPGCHTEDFADPSPVYALEAYTFAEERGQVPEITESRHTF